jgi:hypothetical protein
MNDGATRQTTAPGSILILPLNAQYQHFIRTLDS